MKNQGRKRLLYPLLALGLLVSATIACPSPTPAPALPAEEEEVALEVVRDVDFEVRREIPMVRAGDKFPLPELKDREFHPLPVGHLVTTGEIGEALLQGEFEGQPCTVYVFKNSELCKDFCRESDRKTGNTICLCGGAAGFRGCSNSLVQTETADFDVTGSWFEVFYLPEQQRSLLMVLEGEVEARPVIDVEERVLGEASTVDSGYFWFTDPGARAAPIAGYTGREAHPLEEMLPIVEELELDQWMERTEFRAGLDQVSFPQWTDERPECVVLADRLNIRPGPGTAYSPPITALSRGSVLQPLAQEPDLGWLYVFVPSIDLEGWVSGDPAYVSCNGIRDLPVATALPTPTAMPTATPTRTPVPTGTPRPTPTELPPPRVELPPRFIEVSAACEPCVTLEWYTENVIAVFRDGRPAGGSGDHDVCLEPEELRRLEANDVTEVVRLVPFEVETPYETIFHEVTIRWLSPSLNIWADRYELDEGECTTVHWRSQNLEALYFNGEGVGGTDSRDVCPSETRTYNLRALTGCGEIGRELTIYVTANPDPDNDGLTTDREEYFGTDPNNRDSDGDNLSDGAEVTDYGTDPTMRDTDGDGITDGSEVMELGTDPLDPTDPPRVLYDFVAEAAAADWQSKGYELSFGGSDTDDRGFALWRQSYPMEDGVNRNFVLETHPEWVDWGSIRGTYDGTRSIVLQPNDRFVAEVGLIQGAGAGDVTFQVYFSDAETCFVGEEFPRLIGEARDWYDGQTRYWEVPLSDLAGRRGCFRLTVLSGETSTQDWATWIVARIERR